MLQSFDVNFSYKLRKGSPPTTREYHVSAEAVQDAKLQVILAEKRGCYRFRINSVTPAHK